MTKESLIAVGRSGKQGGLEGVEAITCMLSIIYSCHGEAVVRQKKGQSSFLPMQGGVAGFPGNQDANICLLHMFLDGMLWHLIRSQLTQLAVSLVGALTKSVCCFQSSLNLEKPSITVFPVH